MPSWIDKFLGNFWSGTTPPSNNMNERSKPVATGDTYLDTRTSQTGVTQGGSLMVNINGVWYGVNLTSSTSTTTTTTTTSTTTS